MALETATYISDLVSTNPTASDNISQGDDHIRLLKSSIKATFPNITGAVTATHTELNVLDGLTASTTELNYVDGVTSAIQTQLDAKVTLTGSETLTNKTLTTPVLSGTASGTTAGRLGYLSGVLSYGDGTNQRTVANLNEAQTLTNKTLTNPVINGFTGDTSVVNLGSGQFYKDTSGRVGIGTATPATNSRLDVAGTYAANVVAVSALDIDCSSGNYFTKTISSNSTFTFSNAPASRGYTFLLELEHTSGTVTWPTSVKWPNDVAPTLTTGKTHLFCFATDDGGTRWRGSSNINYTT